MKTVLYIACYPALAALLLLLLALAPAMAQNTVYQGETTALAVADVPGESYQWELYSDGTVNLAKVPGNCPVTSADFVGSNLGAKVNVNWIEPGVYYFKVTVWDPSGCSWNIEIGKMTVIAAKPTAAITPPVPDLMCEGETMTLEVALTGTGPWELTYTTNGTKPQTIKGITESPYLLTVKPKSSSFYRITQVKDKHGTNNETSNEILVDVIQKPVFSTKIKKK